MDKLQFLVSEPACTKSICPQNLYKKFSSCPFALRKKNKFAKNAIAALKHLQNGGT